MKAPWQELVADRRVILRVDHNDPPAGPHHRFRASLPAILRIAAVARQTIVLPHLGSEETGSAYRSTAALAEPLAAAAGPQTETRFLRSASPACIQQALAAYDSARILYCENVRRLDGELRRDDELAQAWANLADVYVADAFSVVHRDHTSVSRLPRYLPSVAGPSLAAELGLVNAIAASPSLGIVVGGGKWKSKLALAIRLTEHGRTVCLAGLTAIVAGATSIPLPASMVLPVDWLVDGTRTTQPPTPADSPVDVGPATIAQMRDQLAHHTALVWNGPLGTYESADGLGASSRFADFCNEQKVAGVHAIAGGGDTIACLSKTGKQHAFTSTILAGGAMLACLAHGDDLPGLRYLGKAH